MTRPLDEVADEFVKEYRQGESPSINDYAERYPEYAQDIRELFPTLVLLERGGKREVLSDLSSLGGPDDHSPCPTKLADYTIIREIGRGGMGVVYEADDPALGRRVALKVLRASPGNEEQAIRRFHREAKMAAQLHHTNVVPVFGTGTAEDKFYYVMQYIPGTSLDQLLSEFNRLSREQKHDTAATIRIRDLAGAAEHDSMITELKEGDSEQTNREHQVELPEDLLTLTPRFSRHVGNTGRGYWGKGAAGAAFAQLKDNPFLHSFPDLNTFICQVGIQVAQALGYAHRHGILHRDIKPSNLLLDNSGIVWVTDFGLAKPQAEDDLTRDGQIIGTLRYMAPEGLEGNFVPQSDIFSLGLSLYELLTLSPAFGETNYSRLIRQVSHSHFVFPRKLDPSIPRDLETIILKATAKDVHKRYQTAEDLADDLRRFLDERPIRARRVGLIEQAWRWTRRNKLSASLLAFIVFLLFIFATVSTIGFVHSRLLLAENEAQSRRAKTNLRLALAAFDDIFSSFQGAEEKFPFPKTEESMSISFAQPVITEKEAKVLESLLSFYDRFVQENGDDRQLLLETARAYAKIGLIRQKQGRSADSIVAYRKSLDFFQKGLPLASTPSGYVVEMADIFNHFLAEINRRQLQNEYFMRIVCEMIDRLHGIPQDSTLKREIAEQLYKLYYWRAFIRVHTLAGEVIKDKGIRGPQKTTQYIFQTLKQDKALFALVRYDLVKSRSCLDQLLTENPDSPELLVSKTKSDCFWGILLLLSDRREEAKVFYDRSLALADQLIKTYPHNPMFKSNKIETLLASSYLTRTDPCAKATDEIKPLTQSLTLIDDLCQDYPLTPQYAIGSILIRYSLGVVASSAGELKLARRNYEDAIECMDRFRVDFPFFTDFQLFPPLYFHYVTLLIDQKEFDKAEHVLRDSLKRFQTIKEHPPESDRWIEEMERLLRSINSQVVPPAKS